MFKLQSFCFIATLTVAYGINRTGYKEQGFTLWIQFSRGSFDMCPTRLALHIEMHCSYVYLAKFCFKLMFCYSYCLLYIDKNFHCIEAIIVK